MRVLVNENKVKVADLNINPVGLIPQKVLLRGVRLTYQTDEEGKRVSDEVIAVKYDVVDPKTLGTMTIKVETNKPIISPEELEASESPITLELPLDQIIIKPYKVEFGSANVSISAPMVKIAKN
jgi:hypothetical protein